MSRLLDPGWKTLISLDLALAVSNGVLLKKRRATMKIKVKILDF